MLCASAFSLSLLCGAQIIHNEDLKKELQQILAGYKQVCHTPQASFQEQACTLTASCCCYSCTSVKGAATAFAARSTRTCHRSPFVTSCHSATMVVFPARTALLWQPQAIAPAGSPVLLPVPLLIRQSNTSLLAAVQMLSESGSWDAFLQSLDPSLATKVVSEYGLQ